MRKIIRHIIHCSDSPDDRIVTVADIDSWHKARGFDCIGYHYVIYKDGSINVGRKVEVIGAHCEGYNYNSIGTCLIGRTMFTDKQYDALKELHRDLKKKFPEIKPYGHHDFNSKKTCPNFDINTILKENL